MLQEIDINIGGEEEGEGEEGEEKGEEGEEGGEEGGEVEKEKKKWYEYLIKPWEKIKKYGKKGYDYFVSHLISMGITGGFLVGLSGLSIWGWNDLRWEGWVSIVIMYLTLLLLIITEIPVEMIMGLAMTLLLGCRIITPEEALVGFSNENVATIGILFVIARGIQYSGILGYLTKYLLRSTEKIWNAQLRMMIPITAISGLINNTPLVAMMIPVIEQWCQKTRLPPSKLMIPLSYAAILGGTITIIGTSTNLIVLSFLKKEDEKIEIPMFEIGIIGAPMAMIGIIYMVVMSKWLLPDRVDPVLELIKRPNEYAVRVKILAESSLIGKRINECLRKLKDVYLIEVEREDGYTIPALDNDIELHKGDILTFVGRIEKLNAVCQLSGIVPIEHNNQYINLKPNRVLIEAVIPNNSSLINKTARSCNFRSRYGAVIMGIHRNGEHIKSEKIGMIKLKCGDCLLLEGNMYTKERTHQDFIIVNELIGGTEHFSIFKMVCASVILVSIIVLNILGIGDLFTLSLIGSFVMLIMKCLTIKQWLHAINIPIMITIAASFSLSVALDKTGVALKLSTAFLFIFSKLGTYGIILGMYICTTLLTSLLSNSTAVAIMFPIIWRMSQLSVKTRIYTLMYAASADFSTPIGYQTNLMVYGPGGYKFIDYVKIGVPLQIIVCLTAVTLIYFIF